MWNFQRGLGLTIVTLTIVILAGCRDGYEVIERSDKPVPDFRGSGTHTEVDYVLFHAGHKIYATCDFQRFIAADPENTCGFRPLRTYPCILGNDSIAHGGPWDLKCKDTDGHNVYLHVF